GLRAVRRARVGSGAAHRRAARPLRRGPGRGGRGDVVRRRLLQRVADHGQALRGVQGAARRRRARLQGADADPQGTDPAGGQAMSYLPEIGYAATVAALVLAAYGGAASAAGAVTGGAALRRSSERAALGVFVLVTCAMLLLVYAFLTFDFSV